MATRVAGRAQTGNSEALSPKTLATLRTSSSFYSWRNFR